MNSFTKCVIYLAAISVGFFVAGRVVPKSWFRYGRYPYRSFRFEHDGRLYRILAVQKWKDRFPDMSAAFPGLMPSKRMPKGASAEHLERMIQETCVAEWTHWLLCLAGFGCAFLWKSIGGWLLSVLYALGNLPYIVIQRYNRPRLVKIHQKLGRTMDRVSTETKFMNGAIIFETE